MNPKIHHMNPIDILKPYFVTSFLILLVPSGQSVGYLLNVPLVNLLAILFICR
jgi:hypothetical protein